MVLSSRPPRAPRTTGGQFATKSEHHVTVAKTRPAHTTSSTHLHSDHTIPNSDSDAFDDDGPPAKKRKLSIRHKQTTLDTHFAVAQSGQPVTLKPPTKITVAQPHGQLLETLNGVRTSLDIDQDELSRRASPAIGRSPERLPQPTKAVGEKKAEEKRTLRSQDDGPRLKSELATYFPEYEEIVFGVEQEEDFITVDTAIYVTDDAKQQAGSAQSSPQKGRLSLTHRRNGSANGVTAPTTPQRSNSQNYNGCSPLDLEMFARNIPDNPEDPLDDAHFFKSHRRAERKEKQLRNIERERAMHEKVQLERLLDGLQGHDWLKVLGVTGITDGEAKKYEPKRDYFIAEVQSLVDKFKQWKEQEKKQRLEKEAAAAREAAESEEMETEEGSIEPPSSELNASASRQLLQETNNAARSGFKIRLSKKGSTSTPGSTPAPTPHSHPLPRPPPTYHPPPSPEQPMTSFFSKRHLRDAALGKARHGRNVLAFGQPIPEMPEREFELPPEYVTENTLRANARERRRRKRASVADAAEAQAEAGAEADGER
ncbi:hypothetical protein LTR85_006352 [Meristemomyces frigidus]|nr:hypothetical protein LTR85_006352 [Meristemomyces frigidus]